MKHPTDVLVVGGGPAGATAARALALGGARVTLIDRARFPRNKPCGGAVSVRAFPTNDINGTLRAEFDARYHSLRTVSAQGSYQWSGRVQTTAGWSKKAFIPELTGFDDTHVVSDVAFRDVRINGRPLTAEDIKSNAFIRNLSVSP